MTPAERSRVSPEDELRSSESDPLAYYLRQIAVYPLLSLQEERDLGERIQTIRSKLERLESSCEANEVKTDSSDVTSHCAEDASAQLSSEQASEKQALEEELRRLKNHMINANLRLVVSVAKKYQHRGLNLLDLIDEGNIGLIEAVERFDYNRGCRFSTYATWWIRQAIVKSLADKGRTIRIPVHMLNTIKNYYFVAKELTQELGRDPENEELSEYMNLSTGKINQIVELSQDTTSLDITVDEENYTRLSDLIEDERSARPFETVFESTLQDTITAVLRKLSRREMRIIELRFGLSGEGPLTLEETGKVLGITRERVRQIQEKAINKLRNSSVIQDFRYQ
ncbi:MAG: sigma-70 family RNA polymerase sigma factor [Spirochaetia bacterium]